MKERGKGRGGEGEKDTKGEVSLGDALLIPQLIVEVRMPHVVVVCFEVSKDHGDRERRVHI